MEGWFCTFTSESQYSQEESGNYSTRSALYETCNKRIKQFECMDTVFRHDLVIAFGLVLCLLNSPYFLQRSTYRDPA